jgi:hypothetical protein
MKTLIFEAKATTDETHGRIFAMCAIVFDEDGAIIDRLEIIADPDQRYLADDVRDNVLPHVLDYDFAFGVTFAFASFLFSYRHDCEIFSDLDCFANLDLYTDMRTNLPSIRCKDLSMLFGTKDYLWNTRGVSAQYRRGNPTEEVMMWSDLHFRSKKLGNPIKNK